MSAEARKVQVSEPVYFIVGKDSGPATIHIGSRGFYRRSVYSASWKTISVEGDVESGYYEVAVLQRWYERVHTETPEEAVQLPLDLFAQALPVPVTRGARDLQSQEVS